MASYDDSLREKIINLAKYDLSEGRIVAKVIEDVKKHEVLIGATGVSIILKALADQDKRKKKFFPHRIFGVNGQSHRDDGDANAASFQ